MKLLFVSNPLTSLNSGRMGGVALNIRLLALEMLHRGHQLQIVAPPDSAIESLPVKEIAGVLQPFIPEPTYNDPVLIPDDAVLANMWDYVRQVETDYDLIIDFGYQWLPFYLSPFFNRSVLHYVCISSWTAVMDRAIERVAHLCPGTLGAHTKAQAATYSVAESFRIFGGAVDVDRYKFCPEPGESFAWAGRISAEKGLEDAAAAAEATGIKLKVFGYLQDQEYWEDICRDYPKAAIEYMGFLPTEKFQAELGKCRALLMTHKWVEAFGLVALEALACGVPIISYRRGGPSEIVVDGKTGSLVEPDDLDELVKAIKQVDRIDRNLCRQRAEMEYSLPAFGDRIEQWFREAIS